MVILCRKRTPFPAPTCGIMCSVLVHVDNGVLAKNDNEHEMQVGCLDLLVACVGKLDSMLDRQLKDCSHTQRGAFSY